MKLNKIPIARTVIDVLDDRENILSGVLFIAAGFVAQWQAISEGSRGIMLIGLVAAGLAVLGGVKPFAAAAYFGKKYSHEAAQLAGKGIDLFESATKIDIDDRVETAAQLAIEKKLASLKIDPAISDRLQNIENKLEALLGASAPLPRGG